jgi:hypothetical protein
LCWLRGLFSLVETPIPFSVRHILVMPAPSNIEQILVPQEEPTMRRKLPQQTSCLYQTSFWRMEGVFF